MPASVVTAASSAGAELPASFDPPLLVAGFVPPAALAPPESLPPFPVPPLPRSGCPEELQPMLKAINVNADATPKRLFGKYIV